ncbi:LysM peptidoglycan-binding domain-containing protein [candidate division KSB1 bacterium]|nr:LysM peptidoglycan-binding domain-containing protein [candidate division KSB1 bacterium]RQW07350.1 MAG: LysM peptidoglycan-binding domain-containing protein [candidate division KSB1 bacterium]
MSGELKKFKIEGFRDIQYNNKVAEADFFVMFNPASYSQKYEVEYEATQGRGTSGSVQQFKRIKPKDYTFDFVFDGTGVTSEENNVPKQIDHFLTLTARIDGEIHRPLYLKISWGSLISQCILKSANISYSLFNSDGYPLRAKITATFSEIIDDERRTAEENKTSPDLTHHRIVKEGDTLPLMTHHIYGDASLYLKVAKSNNLTNFRNLTIGSVINFPPLK